MKDCICVGYLPVFNGCSCSYFLWSMLERPTSNLKSRSIVVAQCCKTIEYLKIRNKADRFAVVQHPACGMYTNTVYKLQWKMEKTPVSMYHYAAAVNTK